MSSHSVSKRLGAHKRPPRRRADRLTAPQQETTIDEASRLYLYEQARATLGEAAADTLMTALPRDPDRFATRDDISMLRSEIAVLGG